MSRRYRIDRELKKLVYEPLPPGTDVITEAKTRVLRRKKRKANRRAK